MAMHIRRDRDSGAGRRGSRRNRSVGEQEMKNLSIRVPVSFYKRLSAAANDKNMTLTTYVLECLEEPVNGDFEAYLRHELALTESAAGNRKKEEDGGD